MADKQSVPQTVLGWLGMNGMLDKAAKAKKKRAAEEKARQEQFKKELGEDIPYKGQKKK